MGGEIERSADLLRRGSPRGRRRGRGAVEATRRREPAGASMHSTETIGAIRETQRRLLSSAGRLLDADLQLRTPQGEPLLSTRPATAAPRPGVLALIAESAQHQRLARSAEGDRPVYAAPIAAQGRLHGVLVAVLRRQQPQLAAPGAGTAPDPPHHPGASRDGDPIGGFLCDLARALADQLDADAVEALRSDRLAAADSEVRLLRGIAERLGDPSDLRSAQRFILEEGRRATRADLGLLSLEAERIFLHARPQPAVGGLATLPRPQLRRLERALADRFDGGRERTLRLSLDELLPGESAVIRLPGHLVAVRLQLGNRRAGLLGFLRAGNLPFSPRSVQLSEALAEQLVLALRSGELYARQSEFLLATVRALISAVEAKDPYTSGHSVRVHVLAMLLAREVGLPTRQLESLKWASILHDVGKIGLPESILNKRGRLTPAEYEVVKEHPRRGYEVLRHIPQLKDASQAVLLHHERIDGHGYPLGVSGDGIPLLARIIAVADTFDALTTTRPYRQSCAMDDAYAEVRRVAGRQLDPEIVAALGRMLPFLREHRTMLALPLGGETDR
ncbi:MAG: HD domain-containing protein [Candidatus Eisenbacteria bacterium]|nr:HD domain-containing protein [Candidatus Eisenbacteria bacterium]